MLYGTGSTDMNNVVAIVVINIIISIIEPFHSDTYLLLLAASNQNNYAS